MIPLESLSLTNRRRGGDDRLRRFSLTGRRAPFFIRARDGCLIIRRAKTLSARLGLRRAFERGLDLQLLLDGAQAGNQITGLLVTLLPLFTQRARNNRF